MNNLDAYKLIITSVNDIYYHGTLFRVRDGVNQFIADVYIEINTNDGYAEALINGFSFIDDECLTYFDGTDEFSIANVISDVVLQNRQEIVDAIDSGKMITLDIPSSI